MLLICWCRSGSLNMILCWIRIVILTTIFNGFILKYLRCKFLNGILSTSLTVRRKAVISTKVGMKYDSHKCSNLTISLGMQPVMFSAIEARRGRPFWRRVGRNICYYRNNFVKHGCQKEDRLNRCHFTATFSVMFEHEADICYLAYHYPYTFTKLQVCCILIFKLFITKCVFTDGFRSTLIASRLFDLCSATNSLSDSFWKSCSTSHYHSDANKTWIH